MTSLAAPLARLSTRSTGIALAFCTAAISGVAVYVNSQGVSRFEDATVYTTAKNAVAGLVLVALASTLLAAPRSTRRRTRPASRRQWAGLAAVAVVGGSVPFVLFFEGLSRATATQAAFIHKSLVLWVALLAVPLLRERVGPAHVAAIGLLLAGQLWLVGEPGVVAFGAGEAMVLAATLLWSVEVVLVKRLLDALEPRTLACARMGAGTVVLVAWLGATGRAGELLALGSEQWAWAVVTGVLLGGYVATWYSALARAQAVDVTAVLVFGAVVTAAIAAAADGAALDGGGLLLITVGAAVAALASRATGRARRVAA